MRYIPREFLGHNFVSGLRTLKPKKNLTVIVRSSCGARTIDITPYGDRVVPLQAPHGLRTGAVRLVHKRRTTESRNFLRAPHGVSRYMTAQATVAVE